MSDEGKSVKRADEPSEQKNFSNRDRIRQCIDFLLYNNLTLLPDVLLDVD